MPEARTYWPWEGIGLPPLPARDPAHEPCDWFETDYDDEIDDPDEEPFEPLPTERHRRVPPNLPTCP